MVIAEWPTDSGPVDLALFVDTGAFSDQVDTGWSRKMRFKTQHWNG
jgi:hypothetical protein